MDFYNDYSVIGYNNVSLKETNSRKYNRLLEGDCISIKKFSNNSCFTIRRSPTLSSFKIQHE